MAILGAMVACGYILYDTSNIINRLDPDDFVFACMSLYLDIIMLFIRLLELLGNKYN
jgi:Integral membrane protein, interacts with FtsH